MKYTFPDSFLWGSSISSYQVEGHNAVCDWAVWERKKGLEPAGPAADHWHRYRNDFSLAHLLGHNALRLSFEWSRIVPRKKIISHEALQHYRDVIDNLSEKGIAPLVTLHHFTNPLWFSREGGWRASRSIDYFLDYVKAVVPLFKNAVTYWITFNEPCVYAYNGFIRGIWPPGATSIAAARTVLKNMERAHLAAYSYIKESLPKARVSIAKSMRLFTPCAWGNVGQNNIFAYLRSRLFNFRFLDALCAKRALDFIGLNYYCQEYVRGGLFYGRECREEHHRQEQNELGWFISPAGLYALLIKLKAYRLPIIITENGTAAKDDDSYFSFLYAHLSRVYSAIQEGVDVKGYFWWSLLDNFEWDKGFWPRFGLIKVKYDTQERQVRQFAWRYKEICEANAINPAGSPDTQQGAA